MSRAHAVLSASSSSRWIACPPSALLQEKYRDYGSVYAEAGSEAHALGECKVLEFLGKPHTDPRSEMKYLDQEMEEGANGRPLLVAYWYKHDLARILKRFPGVRELRTSKDIADWNAGKVPVAAIHPASAGHGLNLQAGGSTLVWFGLTWSLELYQQTIARLWRQGQRAKTVVIHHIITTDTIDEQIMAALKRKDRTQAALIDAVKAQLEV